VKAQELMNRAGLGNHQGPCGQEQLRTLQATLHPLYRLRVVHAQNMLTVTYDGSDRGLIINLLLHHSHYHLILSMPAFFQSSYYCDYCKVEFFFFFKIII
jgi:hypothetical protein